MARDDVDAVIAPALAVLVAQIESGGRPARITPDARLERLDRAQRVILETWAEEMDAWAVETPGVASLIVAVLGGQAITVRDRETLEELAVSQGRRGRALRRALGVP